MRNPENVKKWVGDICDAFNEMGIKRSYYDSNNEFCHNEEYDPEKVEHPKDLINAIAKSQDVYQIFNSQGLINRGFCPVTGEEGIDENSPNYSLFGMVFYMSSEGLDEAKAYSERKSSERFGTLPSSKSGGCYIATVCYGNDRAPEVLLLKDYRDKVLSTFVLGRIFISIYYLVSPRLSRSLTNRVRLNSTIKRFILNPIVNFISR